MVALDAESLWSQEIKEKTDLLRGCVFELSAGIEAYLRDISQERAHFEDSR